MIKLRFTPFLGVNLGINLGVKGVNLTAWQNLLGVRDTEGERGACERRNEVPLSCSAPVSYPYLMP